VKIETPTRSITIEDPPNAENLTQIVVNLSDETVELTYKGHPPLAYTPPPSADAATWTQR
jgi:hypothetical protein